MNVPAMWVGISFLFLIISRLAYVIGTGYMLRQQEQHEAYTRRDGIAAGFARFKRSSTILMVFDTVSFILLNVVTIDTLQLPIPRVIQVGMGVILGVSGLWVKAWATKILGPQAYYWYNFFEPAEPVQWVPKGPYKFLKNPMYSVGYAQTYGLALICGSLHGLIASAFMQICIFIFNATIETPHFEALAQKAKSRTSNEK